MNESVKRTCLYVPVDDYEKTPVSLIATHPLRFGQGSPMPSDLVGLVDIGTWPLEILWAIATRDVVKLQSLTGETWDSFAELAIAGAEKILQEVVNVGMERKP